MAKSKVILWVEDDDLRYFDSCAHVRDYSISSLLNQVLLNVAKDKLVDAVLDDVEKPRPAYVHRYKPQQL